MKVKNIFYIIVILLITIPIYRKNIYGFETHKKIVIGGELKIVDPDTKKSYSYPDSAPIGNSLMVLGDDNKLKWQGSILDATPAIYKEPFLKYREQCPEDTLFLPVVPPSDPALYDMNVRERCKNLKFNAADIEFCQKIKDETRGYCIVTTNPQNPDSFYEPEDEHWEGTITELMPVEKAGYYCASVYDAYLPPMSFYWPRIWSALCTWINETYVRNRFHWDDYARLWDFANAVLYKPHITQEIDTFWLGELEVVAVDIRQASPRPFYVEFYEPGTVDSSIHVICIR